MRTSTAMLVAAALAMSLVETAAEAAIKRQTIEYKHGEQVLEGAIVWDDASTVKRPGVLIYHTFSGPSVHEIEAAERLAGMGYVAFVADIYGKGIRPTPGKEAGEWSRKFTADRPLLRARADAALKELSRSALVDTARIGSIGYCFGGASALELARGGANVLATAVFHATLSSPNPADARNIKGSVLAMHGADDPIAPREQVEDFMKEMRGAKVDWQLILYADTDHGFTTKRNKGAAKSTGNVYNEVVDRRSWALASDLLRERLGK